MTLLIHRNTQGLAEFEMVSVLRPESHRPLFLHLISRSNTYQMQTKILRDTKCKEMNMSIDLPLLMRSSGISPAESLQGAKNPQEGVGGRAR